MFWRRRHSFHFLVPFFHLSVKDWQKNTIHSHSFLSFSSPYSFPSISIFVLSTFLLSFFFPILFLNPSLISTLVLYRLLYFFFHPFSLFIILLFPFLNRLSFSSFFFIVYLSHLKIVNSFLRFSSPLLFRSFTKNEKIFAYFAKFCFILFREKNAKFSKNKKSANFAKKMNFLNKIMRKFREKIRRLKTCQRQNFKNIRRIFREISLRFCIFRFIHIREKKMRNTNENFRIIWRNISFAGNPRLDG